MDKYSINPYVFIFDYDESRKIIFNSNGGSIILLEKNKFKNEIIELDRLASQEIRDLLNEDILIEKKENVIDEIGKKFNVYNSIIDTLEITIELTTKCNFSCTYCYQTGWNMRSKISDDFIGKTFEYINKCLLAKKYKHLAIHLIGGEPLLYLNKIALIADNIRAIKEIYDVDVSMEIDTNGFYLNEEFFLCLNGIPTDLSVTLSLPDDHNLQRPLHNNSKTFDVIIKNIIENKHFFLHDTFELSIRYNTNANNIKDFPIFLDLLVDLGIPVLGVSPMYTDEYPNTNYKNDLTFHEYQIWNSTTAIDEMIKRGFLITEYPQTEPNRCSACSKHSCKIFADGQVSLCDAMYNNANYPSILQLTKNIDLVNSYFTEVKNYNPINDNKCKDCKELILCSGKIFCNKSCKEYSTINLELFLKTLVTHIEQGNIDKFVHYK